MIRSLALIVLFALAPTGAAAQHVERVMDRLTGLWARGDASSISTLSADGGVMFNTDGKPTGPLSTRQVAAMLKRFFDDRETLSVRMMTAQIVGGNPARGFGEISWVTRARGTTIPEKTGIFVALSLEDGQWRITEIRFVKP